MKNSNPEVFIAYRSFDHSIAKVLAQRLQTAGIETWLDRNNLSPRDSWNEAMEAALRQCRVCLILVGTNKIGNSLRSITEHAEAGGYGSGYGETYGTKTALPNSGMLQAIEHRLSQGDFRVIPVLLPGASRDAIIPLPNFLQMVQWIEFSNTLDDEGTFKRLLSAIQISIKGDSDIVATVNATAEGADIAKAQVHVEQPKPKTIQLPDIDWVEIPAGYFIYGEQDKQQRLELERFYISRYPITNAQYRLFIAAGGYQDERWWQNLIKPKPAEPRWKQPNRPRETVNWYEAVAFTCWLSKQLGYSITLPTEQQWEKAARGIDGRKYPWGSGFKTGDANIYDTSASDDNLGQTTTVGLYLHRRSPYGVADMAGNVWEWCLNKYNNSKPLELDSSGDLRVARGGSWNSISEDARSSFRSGVLPGGRPDNFGFRVVSSSPFTERRNIGL